MVTFFVGGDNPTLLGIADKNSCRPGVRELKRRCAKQEFNKDLDAGVNERREQWRSVRLKSRPASMESPVCTIERYGFDIRPYRAY
jgi:hypothetical protein